MTIQGRQETLDKLGSKLGIAWKALQQIDQPATDELPRDRAEAYFIQDVMAQEIAQDLCGWKVGATSAKMRELDGHDDVIPGRIFSGACWQGMNLTLPADRFKQARVETEFAFRLAENLPLRPAPWKVDELYEMVTLHPAIEIIGNRHALHNASSAIRSLMTIADNGGGIGFVFGDPVTDWRSIAFQDHLIKLTVDEQAPAENFLGEMRCVPIQALVDLANHLADRKIELYAGDFVSTGAATVPQAIAAGSRVRADFGSLGLMTLIFE